MSFPPEESPTPKSSFVLVIYSGRKYGLHFGITFEDNDHRLPYMIRSRGRIRRMFLGERGLNSLSRMKALSERIHVSVLLVISLLELVGTPFLMSFTLLACLISHVLL